MQTTVAKVKERRNLNPRSATNGLKGTVSNKTQQSLELLKKGLCQLTDNVKCINPQCFENVNLATLLTTQWTKILQTTDTSTPFRPSSDHSQSCLIMLESPPCALEQLTTIPWQGKWSLKQ